MVRVRWLAGEEKGIEEMEGQWDEGLGLLWGDGDGDGVSFNLWRLWLREEAAVIWYRIRGLCGVKVELGWIVVGTVQSYM